jgi:hypothetical protein
MEKTIGIGEVACLAASAAGMPPPVTIASTLAVDEVVGQCRQQIAVVVRPAVFDGDVLTFEIAGFI